jgi:O-antigen/teichoic acid export membrane protein
VAFGFGRGSVFLFPLALAALMPVEGYGRFEFALSIALIAALALDAGVSASLAYYVLRRKRAFTVSASSAYAVVLQACLLGLAVAVLVTGAREAALVTLLAALLIGQGIAAAEARVGGRPHAAFMFDSLLYSSGFLVLAVCVLMGVGPRLELLAIAWAVVAFALLALHAVRAGRSGWRRSLRRLRPMLAFGRSLVANAFLASALVVMGRTLAGGLLGHAAAGEFAFFFRLASVTLVLHGFLQTMLFRDLYGRPSAEAAEMMSRILALVALAALLVFGALLVFFRATDVFAAYSPEAHVGMLALFFATVVAWSATAQQELLLNQEKLASRMSKWLALVLASMVAVSVALDHEEALTLRRLAAVHNVALLLYLAAQALLLRSRGVDIARSVALAAVAAFAGHVANIWW